MFLFAKIIDNFEKSSLWFSGQSIESRNAHRDKQKHKYIY